MALQLIVHAADGAPQNAAARAPGGAGPNRSGPDELVNILDEVRQELEGSWAIVLESGTGEECVAIASCGHPPAVAGLANDLEAQGTPALFEQPGSRIEWLQGAEGIRATLRFPVIPLASGGALHMLVGIDRDLDHATRDAIFAGAAKRWPLVAAATELWGRLEAEHRLRLGMQEALDHSHLGVVVLDRDGCVQFQNRAARLLVAKREGIRASGRSLAATALGDAIPFKVILEHMLERSRTGTVTGGPAAHVMLLSRGPGKRPVVATLTQAERPARGPGEAAAILYLVKPEQGLGPLLTSLCQLHRLSQAETRLVHELVSGHTLTAAAKTMRVTEHTARAYLKQVFVKTGTNRQSELIRLMLLSLLPLPEDIVAAANG